MSFVIKYKHIVRVESDNNDWYAADEDEDEDAVGEKGLNLKFYRRNILNEIL